MRRFRFRVFSWVRCCKEIVLTRVDFDVLGVDAAYARQGVGAMLVAEGCRRADEDGLEAYLASTPAAMKLYQRFGFEAREEQKM